MTKTKQMRIDDIDEDATIAEVISFFKKRGQHQISKFDKLVDRCGSSTDDLKSVILSDMPRGGNSDNSAEIKLARQIDSRSEIDVFISIFRAMNRDYRHIFCGYYVTNEFHNWTWTEVSDYLGYTRQWSREIMNRAALQFAIRYGFHEGFTVQSFIVQNGLSTSITKPIQTLGIV